MAAEGPKLINLIVCERVLQDALQPGIFSYINVTESVSFTSFPASIPMLCVAAQLTGSHHEYSYQFKVQDRQGHIIAMSPVSQVEPLPNINMTNKLVSFFRGLTFKDEGTYKFVLTIGGDEVASVPFRVVHAPAASSD